MDKPLRLRVIEARGLRPTQGGACDPYATVKLRKGLIDSIRHKERHYSTNILENTCNPQWNEEFIFHPSKPESDVVVVKVFNKEKFKADEFLGKADINISRYLNRGLTDEWIPLKRGRGLIANPGEVRLVLEFGETPSTGATQYGRPEALTTQQPQQPSMAQQAPAPAAATAAAAAPVGVAAAAGQIPGKEPSQVPQQVQQQPQQLPVEQQRVQQPIPSTQLPVQPTATEGVKRGPFGLQPVPIMERSSGVTEIPVKKGVLAPPEQLSQQQQPEYWPQPSAQYGQQPFSQPYERQQQYEPLPHYLHRQYGQQEYLQQAQQYGYGTGSLQQQERTTSF
jgi:hypothetical protein